MVRAIRVITVEQGYDPRKFALLAFGGAGPLLATPLARELGLGTIIVPPGPGLLCALGLLVADARRDFSRTRIVPLKNGAADGDRRAAAAELSAQAERWFAEENSCAGRAGISFGRPICATSARATRSRCRWRTGPGATQRIARLADAFGKEHSRLYGYAADAPVELVTMRLTARVSVSRPPLEVAARTPATRRRGARLEPGSFSRRRLRQMSDLRPRRDPGRDCDRRAGRDRTDGYDDDRVSGAAVRTRPDR